MQPHRLCRFDELSLEDQIRLFSQINERIGDEISKGRLVNLCGGSRVIESLVQGEFLIPTGFDEEDISYKVDKTKILEYLENLKSEAIPNYS